MDQLTTEIEDLTVYCLCVMTEILNDKISAFLRTAHVSSYFTADGSQKTKTRHAIQIETRDSNLCQKWDDYET